MPTKKKSYSCPECEKKKKQIIKEKEKMKRINHKVNEKSDFQAKVRRNKKGHIKDFDFDFSHSHSQSISLSFD